MTALLLVLDLSGFGVTRRLAGLGAGAFGPLERAVGGLTGGDARVEQLTRERDALAEQVRALRSHQDDAAALRPLLADPDLSGARVVAARVVASQRPVVGGRGRLTLDVGTRDGVQVDRAVVADGGLVGRVVAAGPWTCDVAVLGDPAAVVGVRVGAAGPLGRVGGGSASLSGAVPGPQTGGGASPAGGLSLEVLTDGAVAAGAVVTTAGSPGGRPYPAGLRVGTLRSVDPRTGGLVTTGSLTPAVDVTRLRVVAVLLGAPRSTPRPASTAGAP